MVSASVAIEVIQFLREFAGVLVPSSEFDLFGAGGMDSMQVFDLVAFLEERFAVSIPSERLTLDELRTPARIGALVASMRPGA